MIGRIRLLVSLSALLLLVGPTATPLFIASQSGEPSELCAGHVCACSKTGCSVSCCCAGDEEAATPNGPKLETFCGGERPIMLSFDRAAVQPIIGRPSPPPLAPIQATQTTRTDQPLTGYARPIDKVPITPELHYAA